MKNVYNVPSFEIINVNLEQGFATSGQNEGFGNSEGEW